MKKVIGYLVVGLLFSALFVWLNDKPSASLPASAADAFARCKDQLRIIAHPASLSAPTVKDNGRGSEHYFAWPSGSGLYFGARQVSASCIVDGSTMEITQLTVDGKDRIWRKPEK